MDPATRWQRWHEDYAVEGTPLARRLQIVRRHVAAWLDARPDEPLTVVSVCAGQGHDLIGVLAGRADHDRVRARLVENDAGNAALARTAAAELTGVEVECADAADPASYAGAVPADLVLLVGVLGNISDADVERTIAVLPQLCAAGATVIWTRTRRPPDRPPPQHPCRSPCGSSQRAGGLRGVSTGCEVRVRRRRCQAGDGGGVLVRTLRAMSRPNVTSSRSATASSSTASIASPEMRRSCSIVS